jgi:hypothetical protein
MENDFVMDCLLPLTMLLTPFVLGALAVDGYYRIKAKVTGTKCESPIVW